MLFCAGIVSAPLYRYRYLISPSRSTGASKILDPEQPARLRNTAGGSVAEPVHFCAALAPNTGCQSVGSGSNPAQAPTISLHFFALNA
jgi:hypothetical protein